MALVGGLVSFAPVRAEGSAEGAHIDSLFARYGPDTPGVAIRVVKDGQVVFAGEYGLANLEHPAPITPSTVFPLGSVSKQFTGFAVAMLAEEGKIDLDADVRTYVPEVPDFGGAVITVRHLLHHTSGIRDWVRPLAIAGWHAADVIDLGEVLEFLWRQEKLNFPPGERHMYSNTGYVLLSEIVARVTEQSFPEWMAQNVFGPLGMETALVREHYYDLVPSFAASYYPLGERYARVPNSLTAYGSCCIAMTIDDLVRWVRHLDRPRFGEVAVRRMHEDTVPTDEWDGRLVAYGYGVYRFEYRGVRGFFHSGQWVGHRAAILRVPDENLAIVALSNAGPRTNLREWDILGLYVSLDEPERVADDEWATVPIAADAMDRYAGVYDLGLGETLEITREGDRLIGRFASDSEAAPLSAISAVDFQFRADGDTLRFDPDGQAAEWKGERAPRVEPFDPTVAELGEFTGAFYSRETESTIRFLVEDGGLVGRNIRWGESLPFRPTVADRFRGQVEIDEARFVRDEDGDVREVLISGRRARGLRFLKLGEETGPSTAPPAEPDPPLGSAAR